MNTDSVHAVNTLPPLKECKVCHRNNRAQQRRGMCHSCYEKDRRAGKITSPVSAAPARHHIAVLRLAGWKYNEIGRAARIDAQTVAFIVGGRSKINADTAFHICAIDPTRRAEFIKRVDPAVIKARTAKAAASLSPQARAERSRKIWATRRANEAAAKAAAETLQTTYEELRAEWAAKDTPPAPLLAPVPNDPVTALLAALGVVEGVQDWREDALCAQVDHDIFFPEKGGATRAAKEICLSCPVREACLAFALDGDERFGIWGGKSERERRAILNARKADQADDEQVAS